MRLSFLRRSFVSYRFSSFPDSDTTPRTHTAHISALFTTPEESLLACCRQETTLGRAASLCIYLEFITSEVQTVGWFQEGELPRMYNKRNWDA